MAIAATPPSRPRRRRPARIERSPLDRFNLDDLFREARRAYAHLPPARQRRVIALIIRRQVMARLRHAPVAAAADD